MKPKWLTVTLVWHPPGNGQFLTKGQFESVNSQKKTKQHGIHLNCLSRKLVLVLYAPNRKSFMCLNVISFGQQISSWFNKINKSFHSVCVRFVFGLCSVCVTSSVWSHIKLVLYLYLSSHYQPEYILYAESICPVQLWLHSHTIISHEIILNYSWRLSLPCCLFFDGQLEAIGNTFRPSKHIQFRPYQAHVNVFDFVWHFI